MLGTLIMSLHIALVIIQSLQRLILLIITVIMYMYYVCHNPASKQKSLILMVIVNSPRDSSLLTNRRGQNV